MESFRKVQSFAFYPRYAMLDVCPSVCTYVCHTPVLGLNV